MSELTQVLSDVATGRTVCRPQRIKNEPPELRKAVRTLMDQLDEVFPNVPNSRWVALRLLEGDTRIMEAVCSGELGDLNRDPGRQEEVTA